MLLDPGETLLSQESAERVVLDDRRTGILYLTSKRLVFERHVGGGLMRSGSVTTELEVFLPAIRNVSRAPPRFMSTGELIVETPGYMHAFRVNSPEGWAHAIIAARSTAPALPEARPPPVARPSYPDFAPVVVNVAQPAATSSTIERQVVKVRCRHCGGLSDEVLGKCQRCGAPL